MSDRDVVIAGGGPAGATAALVAARGGARVLLVEAAPARTRRIGESLPPAAWPLLRTLGVADAIRAHHAPSPGTRARWGASVPRTADFLFDVHGPGILLDRARFDDQLRAAAVAAGAELIHSRVVSARHLADAISIDVAGAGPLIARTVIDATGRAASVSRALGARRHAVDALVAFVATLRPRGSPALDCRALVEACADGWWYSAGAPSGERVVAWFTDPDLAALAALRSADGFAALLASAPYTAAAACDHVVVGRPQGAAAATAWLIPMTGARWIAVGDAVTAFDPLSSQGIFHALYTGLRAGERALAMLDGAPDTTGYADRIAAIRAAYSLQRLAAYGAESRWCDRPFWSRRGSPITPRAMTNHPGRA